MIANDHLSFPLLSPPSATVKRQRGTNPPLAAAPTPCPACGSDRHMTRRGKKSDGSQKWLALCLPCKRQLTAKYRQAAGGGAAYTRDWAERNPEKRKAHRLVWSRMKRGKLDKQPCERCGSADVHAHHDDYSRPLDVMWLCPTHHAERHRELAGVE